MPPLSLHGRASLLALLPIALFAIYVGLRDSGAQAIGTADVGVQLTEPAALSFTVGTRRSLRLIEISHNAPNALAISVPEAWVKTEVRGVPLDAVVGDEPSLGYVRWTIPPKATVSFRSAQPFDGIRVHNPSQIPLTARITAVDLDRNSTHVDARMLQGSAVTLPLTDEDDTQRLP